MPTSSVLFAVNYLPAVSYFHAIHKEEYPLRLEKYEHYPKQTYRNRTRIATANGVLDLILPVKHGRKQHVAMKDVKINYDHDWQRLHWLSIQTAYRSSAYFEYYEDDFKRLYDTDYEYLFDYNVAQLELVMKCLKLNRTIEFTEKFAKSYDIPDFRNLIHPKRESVYENPKSYYQVFEERTGFLPEVSIIDLVFNQGPQSKNYL